MKRLSPSSPSGFVRCLWSLLPVLLSFALVGQTSATTWTQQTISPPTGSNLKTLWIVDATHAWATGGFNDISFWNGTSWSQQTYPNPPGNTANALYQMWAADASHIWAVGEHGYMTFYNGSSWVDATPPTSVNTLQLDNVWGTDANHVWAAGARDANNQETFLFWDGTSWSKGTVSNSQQENVTGSMHGLDATHIWVGATQGYVYFFNGTNWTPTNVGTTQGILGVFALDSTHVWAVGNAGVISFWNGSTWALQTSPVATPLRSIWAADATHAWAVGNNSAGHTVIVIWNGTSWAVDNEPIINASLNCIKGLSSAGQLMVIGNSSTSLTGTFTISSPAPTITSVTTTTAAGQYKAGTTILVTVNFSSSVTVTGTPTLALNSGATVNYSSGSPGTALTFSYTVGAGQTASALDTTGTSSLGLNGGTINATTGGTAATLTLPTPGAAGSLSNGKTIVIDTTRPTVSSITRKTPTGQTTGGTSVTFHVVFSEAVQTETAANFSVQGINGGTVTGTIGTVTGSGTTWDVPVTITGGAGEFKLVVN